MLLVRLFFWERVAADAVLVDLRFLEVVVVVVVLLGWRPFSETTLDRQNPCLLLLFKGKHNG